MLQEGGPRSPSSPPNSPLVIFSSDSPHAFTAVYQKRCNLEILPRVETQQMFADYLELFYAFGNGLFQAKEE